MSFIKDNISNSCYIVICFILVIKSDLNAQRKLDFSGQVSGLLNYSPENDFDGFAGGRYLPELNYKIKLDTLNSINFEASANVSAAVLFKPFSESITQTDLAPYRIWIRYAHKKLDFRVGLQKIDFGSASIIRPLQWFNQIDFRDPLQLTNGVYSALSRYYFKNNANIWAWALYGNDKRRGFDLFPSDKYRIEFGTRAQLPVSKGEIAFSYHNRKVDTTQVVSMLQETQSETIQEHRFGFDAKLDVLIGLWLEASYAKLEQKKGVFTNQALLNLGGDYTFGVGNGLNVNLEHLINTLDEKQFAFKNNNHFTAMTLGYPISFFDNISGIGYYTWTTKDVIVSINYEHQFKSFTGYFIGYYNPESNVALPENEFVNSFSGFGIRVMAVFNH